MYGQALAKEEKIIVAGIEPTTIQEMEPPRYLIEGFKTTVAE